LRGEGELRRKLMERNSTFMGKKKKKTKIEREVTVAEGAARRDTPPEHPNEKIRDFMEWGPWRGGSRWWRGRRRKAGAKSNRIPRFRKATQTGVQNCLGGKTPSGTRLELRAGAEGDPHRKAGMRTDQDANNLLGEISLWVAIVQARRKAVAEMGIEDAASSETKKGRLGC